VDNALCGDSLGWEAAKAAGRQIGSPLTNKNAPSGCLPDGAFAITDPPSASDAGFGFTASKVLAVYRGEADRINAVVASVSVRQP
jgi:hypothetical protein